MHAASIEVGDEFESGRLTDYRVRVARVHADGGVQVRFVYEDGSLAYEPHSKTVDELLDAERWKRVEQAPDSCTCRKGGQTTEDCPWKCPLPVIEPDASNAKCMVRGHDWTPDHFDPAALNLESPICARCSSPKPGVTVLVHGYTRAHDVLLVLKTDAETYELWIDGALADLPRAQRYRDGGTCRWHTDHGELCLWRRRGTEPQDWLGIHRIVPHGEAPDATT